MTKINSVFSEYLDLNLLPQFNNESYKEHTETVVVHYLDSVLRDKSKLVDLSLLLVNPGRPPEAFQELKGILKTHWLTSTTVFSDNASAFFRMLGLETLSRAIKNDPHAAFLVHQVVASLWSRFNQVPRTKELYEWVWRRAADAGEAYAQKQWSNSSEAKEVHLDLDVQSPTLSIDTERFRLDLNRSTWPNDKNGVNFSPMWNQYQAQAHTHTWAAEFAKHATDVITDAILNTVQDSNKQLVENLSAATRRLSTELSTFAASVQEAARPKELRLLWWMQSLYSETVHESYREVSMDRVPLLLLLDVHRLAPSPAPASVTHLLAEAYRAAHPPVGKQQGKKTLQDWLVVLSQFSFKTSLLRLYTQEREFDGPGLLLGCVLHALSTGSPDPVPYALEVGLPLEAELTPYQLLMWLWRDHMVLQGVLHEH